MEMILLLAAIGLVMCEVAYPAAHDFFRATGRVSTEAVDDRFRGMLENIALLLSLCFAGVLMLAMAGALPSTSLWQPAAIGAVERMQQLLP